MAAAAPASPSKPGAALPLWLPLLVGAGLRLVQIQAPILGIHSWRQADTAAMARNFAEQGMNLLTPQIDWGGAGSGVVEAEFPLYPYAVALLYRVFGVQEWLARGLSVLFSVLTILLVVRIGRQLLGERAGWWGGLFYALLPIPVFYGRTVQPEATLMLLAALALERFLAWLRTGRLAALGISWLAFTAACLIKVLPFVWLGLPLLWLWGQAHRWRIARRLGSWAFALAALAATAAWYWHAHQLGQASGLSFGFWGGEANRYTWADLFTPGYWLGLGLRVAVRNLAVLGVPLLVLGLLPRGNGGAGANGGAAALPDALPGLQARVLPVGLAAVLLAGALAPESSAVHEYYQLPLMLFACPLMGLGWVRLRRQATIWGRQGAWALLTLLILVSLTVLGADYWSRERVAGSPVWELAQQIQSHTAPGAKVVVMSGSDPTVLYLANRKGWLVSPKRLMRRDAAAWRADGADALAGSFAVIESYAPFPEGELKTRLKRWVCDQPPGCQSGPGFVIPLAAGAERPAG